MGDNYKKTDQDVENTGYKKFSEVTEEEKWDRFDEILYEITRKGLLKTAQEIEELGEVEILPPSKRHKKRMNRLFRERVGGDFLPFPEVDSIYERVRSKIVVKLKINEFCDNRKRRKREKGTSNF